MFSSNDARRRALKRKCRDVRLDDMSRVGCHDKLRAKSALKLSVPLFSSLGEYLVHFQKCHQ